MKTRRTTDQPKTDQVGPQKRAASSSERMESCRKIRKPEDLNPNDFKPWSPQVSEKAQEAYLARSNSNSATNNNTPTVTNWNGSPSENISGRANGLNNVEKSPITPLFSNSTKRTEDLISPCDKSLQEGSDSRHSKVVFNGKDITSYIEPLDLRTAYFKLCSAHNSELHNGLKQGLDIEDVVDVITQTAKISKAIENCSLSTGENRISYWIATLDYLSNVGMGVDFMLGRVNRLLELKKNAEKFMESNSLEETMAEAEQIKENIADVKFGIEKMKEKIKSDEIEVQKMEEKKISIDQEVVNIQRKNELYKNLMIREASAPW